MSSKKFTNIVEEYFKCKKLLKDAQDNLFEVGLPMDEMLNYETKFNQYQIQLKQLNFGNLYDENNSHSREIVHEIYQSLVNYYMENYPDGKEILQKCSEKQTSMNSSKGLKDILNNINNVKKEIGIIDNF